MIAHVKALRETTLGRRAQIIYIPELAGGHGIGHVHLALLEHFRHRKQEYDAVFRPKSTKDSFNSPEGDPGIVTHPASKSSYAESARMHIQQGTVKLARDFVVANPYARDDAGRPVRSAKTRHDDILKLFEQEVRNYQMHDITSDNPTSRKTAVVSGVIDKYGKRNRSAHDDLMMAFTMNMRCCDLLLQRQMPNFDHQFIP